ncbi:MAG: hypothetical protein ACTH31_03545, partial [Pseudoclavibacter sp.]
SVPESGGAGRGPFRRDGAGVAIVVTVIGAVGGIWALGSAAWDSGFGFPAQSRGIFASGWGGGWSDGDGSWYDGPPTFNWSDNVNVEGVEAIEIDGSASDITVEFADIEDATLDVETTVGPEPAWTFEVEDDVLTVVETHDGGFTGPISGWAPTTALVTLPESMRGDLVDLSATISSGALTIDGDFGDVELVANSGGLLFMGGAETMDVDVQSGFGDVTVADADEVAIDVGSGAFSAVIEGEQPSSIAVDVNSGWADVMVPAGEYRVSGDVQSGARDINVDESTQADSTLEVNVSSGGATVSEGDM